MSRVAKRSKSLDVEKIAEDRASFVLALEDKCHSSEGVELIHSLRISGMLALPSLEIVSIEPVAVYHPHPECAASLEPVRQMVGTRIGPGFRKRVIELMGQTRGCTHFMTLIMDLGAAHTLSVFLRMREKSEFTPEKKADGSWIREGLAIEPRLENACVALQTSSPIIQRAKKLANDNQQ
ncbi:hypothetical protein FHS85_004265 [Rhodoligotrophos appendicifer]|uniref:DUF2889 domain-containing protein n=1 Tax=Rhodoligotrophos appendicifer TaxID=987056 RepID=UPI001185D569|nr:DUF2889 domain-containing protein [Rhodoligotrophos appendicifer]